MNLRFRDFSLEIPQLIDGVLEDGCALNLKLNRWGTLLSAGCQDGRVVVWDVDTRSRAAILIAHTGPVSCTAFSHCGFYLASCAIDGTVVVTALETQSTVATFSALPPALTVQFNPRDPTQLLLTRLNSPPVIMKIDYDAHTITPLPVSDAIAKTLDEAEPKDAPVEESKPVKEDPVVQETQSKPKKKKSRSQLNQQPAVSPEHTPCFSAVFSRRGSQLYIGTLKGLLLELDANTGTLLRKKAIADDDAAAGVNTRSEASHGIKSLEVSRDGHFVLITGIDRFVRVYDLRTFTFIAELRDDVNRQQFRKCSFSPSALYLVACSTTSESHDLGIWSKEGELIQNVKGISGDRLVDVAWHPFRPMIFSCGSSGCIYAWNSVVVDSWHTYAPTFIDLEENREYIEREDEFDFVEGDVPLLEDGTPAKTNPDGTPLVLPPKPADPNQTAISADEPLDITTICPIMAYLSGSDDDKSELVRPQLKTIMPELKPFLYQDTL